MVTAAAAGPATYNTRTQTSKQGFVFTKDTNRAMSRGMPTSPGPKYSIADVPYGAGRVAPVYKNVPHSMGSGHKPINDPNLASPGPKYLPGDASYSGSRQPSFTFRGGKLRGAYCV